MSAAITLYNLFRSDRPGERLLPLGCLWLRAALEAEGFSVDLRDAQHLPEEVFADAQAQARRLDDSAPVIGISCMVDALPHAVQLARELKKRAPERRVILGGPGPTAVARLLVERFPWIDVVVRGEGERTLVELLRTPGEAGLGQIPGIDARTRAGLVSTPDRPLVHDLDALPDPRIDDLGPAAYSYYSTIGSRGCNHACAFCEISVRQRRRVRLRSVERIVAEVVHAKERWGVDSVAFQDDIFLQSRPRVERLLKGLADADAQVGWFCFSRVDQIDGAWLRTLAARGLTRLSLGIEAGSTALLRRLGKGFGLGLALRGVRDAARVVPTTCFFQWGFPDESLEEFLGTLQALHHCQLLGADTELGQVVPLAGSRLHRRYRGRLRYLERFPYGRIVTPPERPELAELVRAHPDLFCAFYSFETPDWETKVRLLQGMGPSA